MKKNMKILYFSPTVTTKKTVVAIARGISESGATEIYDMTLPESRDANLSYGSDDILLVGVPVYGGRVPELLLPFLGKIKGDNTLAIFVAVYGNRDYDDALLELKNVFEENGFIGIAAGAFIGEHSFTNKLGGGRPDTADLTGAEKFGNDIAEKIKTHRLGAIGVKGSFPYKERMTLPPMSPDTNDTCTQCGLCAKSCPMGAIDLRDSTVIDSSRCIRCNRCVEHCPVDAKSFNHEVFKQIEKMLIENYSLKRCEPELFI